MKTLKQKTIKIKMYVFNLIFFIHSFGTTTIKFFNLIEKTLFDWQIKQKLEN